MTPLFYGKVENGRLKLDNRERFDSYLSGLQGDVQVIVEKRKKRRSNQQNRWYQGCILKMMAEATGHTTSEIHEAMKTRFNCGVVNIGSQIVVVPKTTTKLMTKDFADYCERVRSFAASELGLVIPDPDPWYQANGYEQDAT